MEDFTRSLEDDPLKDELFDAIRGRGAFRRFKDKVYYHYLEDNWYAFKNRSLKKIAIGFLDSKGIPWKDEESES